MRKITIRSLFITSSFLSLAGCSSFTGIRTPLYDGEPFVPQPEAIDAYDANREIMGDVKNLYTPEAFSEDILKASMDYINHEPILLEGEGTYVVGEDIPASRVTLFGEKNNPNVDFNLNADPFAPPKPEEYEVGTMTIRDAAGNTYFENMFHPEYGVLATQVNLIEGHTIEITGNNPNIVVFYDAVLPDNPYIFDTRWEDYLAELEAQGAEFIQQDDEDFGDVEVGFIGNPQDQPIIQSEEEQSVYIKAGIYEVGVHLEAGLYEVSGESVPNHTAMYVFRDSLDPLVYAVSRNIYGIGHRQYIMNTDVPGDEFPRIELKEGDIIYPHYVDFLLLTKINE